jgi:hypothetical protein
VDNDVRELSVGDHTVFKLTVNQAGTAPSAGD